MGGPIASEWIFNGCSVGEPIAPELEGIGKIPDECYEEMDQLWKETKIWLDKIAREISAQRPTLTVSV